MDNKSNQEKLQIRAILNSLTIEEKASLCSGKDSWTTKSIERHGLKGISVADGPHGLRKVLDGSTLLNTPTSLSTCFPTSSALGASWNKDIIYETGCALGRECIDLGVDILLSPGINMKRSPLCGRNFEYFSEDPYHTAECAIAYIKGVQDQGVGTSLKHFACNNQELNRFSIDAIVDERTLREIYLRAFELVLKSVEPWTVMSSYNSLNNILVSENKRLLTDILREEWGYNGLVVSDWASIYDRVKALAAGCDLDMPGKAGLSDEYIVQAVKSGELEESVLDKTVSTYISLLNKAHTAQKNKTPYDPQSHHTIAHKAAAESIILLKNDEAILPVNKETIKTIAVIGEFARQPRFQGKGSSLVNARQVDIPLDEIKQRAGAEIKVTFSPGYFPKGDKTETRDDTGLINEAKKSVKDADIVLFFAGTEENEEVEGIDRINMDLPDNQNRLISTLSGMNKNIVVILSNGSAVTMPWHKDVKAILETGLSGEAMGSAMADILFGSINPSGKLTETFPLRLEDTPAYIDFPGDHKSVHYTENLYIGYRYYDKRNMDVLFPFGFGLSYTTFDYSHLTVTPTTLRDSLEVKVSVTIKNTGKVYGKEIVQLYIRDPKSSFSRPEKELKSFEKTGLAAGEEKTISLYLNRDAFSHYDVKRKKWCVESGEFEILLGSSSRDIRCKQSIQVFSEDTEPLRFTPHSYIADFYENGTAKKMLQEWFNKKPNIDVDLERFNGLEREGIKTLPLSKFTNFMPEVCTLGELRELTDNINRELEK
ncbi:MAG: glycoside hydrolase family 3 C-terminal domain-containing protein [Spirochaetales bacterium]|nr:glycoside hydrolase family 3 C-terminal domain-containing protein [Spirochaetales bacterium]